MWKKIARQRKMQTIMIFFIILLCTVLLNGAMTILKSLNQPYQNLREECNSPDVCVYLYPMSDEDRQNYTERFKSLTGVSQVEDVKYRYLEEEIQIKNSDGSAKKKEKVDAYLDLTEYNKAVYGSVRYVQGSKESVGELEDGKCMIPACLSNEYDLNVGDSLTVKASSGDIEYEVAAVYADVYNTSTAFDACVLVKNLPKSLGTFQHSLKITTKDGVKGEEIREEYQKQYHGVFQGFFETTEEAVSNGLIAINIVAAVFLAMGIIMLIVSGLIIHFMIRNVMLNDAKSIAIYKTIGYTTNDILKMYLTFYAVVVTVAAVLGVLASKLLCQIVLSDMFDNLGENSNILVLNTGIPCIIVIVGFVLAIIYLIMRKTRRVKPIYALNGMQNTNSKKKKYRGNASNGFSPMAVALRNINRDKRGVIGIAITLIVTIFAVNFAIISLDVAFSQKDNNDYWIGIDPSNVLVNVSDTDNYAKVADLIREDSRVDHQVSLTSSQNLYFDWEDSKGNTSMSAFVYEDYSAVDLPVIEGRNPENADEITLSATVAEAFQKNVGDYISIYMDGENKESLLITGIFQSYYQMGYCCRIRSDALLKREIPVKYSYCSVYLKDAKKQAEFIADMQDKLGNQAKVLERTEGYASIMNMITKPQKSGIPPVIALVFVISAINIFCIILLKNSNNRKSHEIYKSIGYETKDLILTNLYYVGIVSMVAMIIAIPLTLLTYPYIMTVALSTFGFRSYPFTFSILHLVLVNVGAVILFIVSTLISSIPLRRVDVRDLVIE